MTILELVVATLFASVVGSLHCVGMCSPFAILALGNAQTTAGPSQSWMRMGAYHIGRLATYLLICSLMLLIAEPLRWTSTSLRGGNVVAWLVGGLLIGIGSLRLIRSFRSQPSSLTHSVWLQSWSRILGQARKALSRGPQWVTAFVWGFTSTLLPCGWLYFFVLASAAAPSPMMAYATMISFWLGTLPMLSLSTWGLRSLQPNWNARTQVLASCFIVGLGLFTLMYRGHSETHVGQNESTHRLTLDSIRQTINAGITQCFGGIPKADASQDTTPKGNDHERSM